MSGHPPGLLSRRQEYAEATRSAVLHAAEELFAGGDVSNVSVDDVARAARVSKGTVYHHFVDKAALFEAVYRRHQTWVAADVAAAVARHGDPWRQLWAAMEAYLATGSEGGGEGRSTVLMRSAPAVLGLDRSRAVEEELVLPCLCQVLDRLAGARRLVSTDAEAVGRLVLGTLREAALMSSSDADVGGGAGTAAVAKLVRSMVQGLERRRPPGRPPGRPPSRSPSRSPRAAGPPGRVVVGHGR